MALVYVCVIEIVVIKQLYFRLKWLNICVLAVEVIKNTEIFVGHLYLIFLMNNQRV